MKRINNKRINITVMLKTLVAVFIVAVSLPASADYELYWYTIDGGGGKSNGGDYALFGTIGQPDTEYSQGGSYVVSGGFWAGGPLCTVDFVHYARFAEWWLESDCDAGNDFCGGADLPPRDGVVDGNDLDLLVKQWLYYCPLDWSLK